LADYPGVREHAAIHELATDDLNSRQIDQIRELLWAAFADDEHGGFTEDDWQHALGGTHFVSELEGTVVAHASVVERSLHVDGVPLRTGYVEAVATLPAHQGRGHGSALMSAVNGLIERDFEIGALGTGSQGFYERLGWQIWRGPSAVRTERGDERTPDEDGYIMVLTTPSTPPIALTEPISCEWREGDVW
jgi:aminoglycoside 2'-N-acetyltransferase I